MEWKGIGGKKKKREEGNKRTEWTKGQWKDREREENGKREGEMIKGKREEKEKKYLAKQDGIEEVKMPLEVWERGLRGLGWQFS